MAVLQNRSCKFEDTLVSWQYYETHVGKILRHPASDPVDLANLIEWVELSKKKKVGGMSLSVTEGNGESDLSDKEEICDNDLSTREKVTWRRSTAEKAERLVARHITKPTERTKAWPVSVLYLKTVKVEAVMGWVVEGLS